MVSLAEMQLLVLVAEYGSLAAAARKVGISSAAVSKQLTKMEKILGVQLLLRSTRRVELTLIGRDYCTQCKRVLEEADEAKALISQLQATPSGPLHILSGRHFANAYIIPHIDSFLLKYPNIHLNLELGERQPNLNEEALDIVIGMSITPIGEVIQRRIASTTYVYCASPKYLKKFGLPKKPDDLKKHRYITHSMRKPDDVIEFQKGKSISVKPYIRVNDAQTMLDFALAGLGIVKLHRYVVQRHLEAGELLELFPNENQPEVPIYVAYPQRRYLPSKTRCFIDFITGFVLK